DAGSGKTVIVTNLSLTGPAAGNYQLLDPNPEVQPLVSVFTSADITPANVTATVTAGDRLYDSTVAATLTNCTLSGVTPGDVVSCGGTGSFASATVGTGKTVTSSNLTLGGAAAANYALSLTTASTTANITAATLTPAITASNKTYDGTATATIACTLTGVI